MLELSQVQSDVLRGYRQGEAPKYVNYLFLRFTDGPAIRELLLALYPRVTSCTDYDAGIPEALREAAGPRPYDGATLNIGLAYPSLELLGLGGNARALDERDHEATGAIEAFKCGMKARAADILGDRGPSAPEQWEPAFQDELHAVLSLASSSREQIASLRGEVEAAIEACAGAELVHEETAQHFDGALAGKEHFGFADGIAQPSVLGSGLPGYPGDGTPRKRRGWKPVQPGEFVLGQIDESGRVQFGSELFKHGSFMVFRKLRQHVGRFRDYTRALAARRGTTAEYVGAKMIGRWPSGAPLVRSPKRDDPKLGADPERNNDFRYADDADGQRCPFGAHIRRNNPREDPSGPQTSQTRLHRIIRRGTPYGSWLPEDQADDGSDRGILFIVINADIARQFEFVQQNWVDDVLSSTHLTLASDRDPLIGSQTEGAKFVIPSSSRRDRPLIAWDLPSFVTTRGGAYFLLPSIDALYDIAHDVEWPSHKDPCESGQDQGGGEGECPEPEAEGGDGGGGAEASGAGEEVDAPVEGAPPAEDAAPSEDAAPVEDAEPPQASEPKS